MGVDFAGRYQRLEVGVVGTEVLSKTLSSISSSNLSSLGAREHCDYNSSRSGMSSSNVRSKPDSIIYAFHSPSLCSGVFDLDLLFTHYTKVIQVLTFLIAKEGKLISE